MLLRVCLVSRTPSNSCEQVPANEQVVHRSFGGEFFQKEKKTTRDRSSNGSRDDIFMGMIKNEEVTVGCTEWRLCGFIIPGNV